MQQNSELESGSSANVTLDFSEQERWSHDLSEGNRGPDALEAAAADACGLRVGSQRHCHVQRVACAHTCQLPSVTSHGTRGLAERHRLWTFRQEDCPASSGVPRSQELSLAEVEGIRSTEEKWLETLTGKRSFSGRCSPPAGRQEESGEPPS